MCHTRGSCSRAVKATSGRALGSRVISGEVIQVFTAPVKVLLQTTNHFNTLKGSTSVLLLITG